MNCRHFKPKYAFQVEVLRHMVGRFVPAREKELLRTIFDALDVEKDGELEPEEFIGQFHEKFKLQLGHYAMERMVLQIDFGAGKNSGDGLIQFTEFIMAACDKKLLLSEENIRKEFQYLDRDQDGFINENDIEKLMFGFSDPANHEATDFKNILQEIMECNRVKEESMSRA